MFCLEEPVIFVNPDFFSLLVRKSQGLYLLIDFNQAPNGRDTTALVQILVQTSPFLKPPVTQTHFSPPPPRAQWLTLELLASYAEEPSPCEQPCRNCETTPTCLDLCSTPWSLASSHRPSRPWTNGTEKRKNGQDLRNELGATTVTLTLLGRA